MDSFWILVLSITLYFIVIGFIINQNEKVGGFILIGSILIFLGYVVYLLGFVYLRLTLGVITFIILGILSLGIPIVVVVIIYEYLGIKRFYNVIERSINSIKSKTIKNIIKIPLVILVLVVVVNMFEKYFDFVSELSSPIFDYINHIFLN